jgi:hypothetical protein
VFCLLTLGLSVTSIADTTNNQLNAIVPGKLDKCFNRQTTKEHRKSSKRQLQKNQTGSSDTTQHFIAYYTIWEEKEEFVTIFRL